MTEPRKHQSPARTTLTVCWALAIGWVVFAGAGGAAGLAILVLLGYLCFAGAVVTLIVGLVLRSGEKRQAAQ